MDEIKREILAPGIISYSNVGENISNMVPEWEEHVKNGSLNWAPHSYVGENINVPEARKVKLMGISNDGRNEIIDSIREHFDNAYKVYVDDYCERYRTNTIGSDAYQILKYEIGHHYKAHTDWGRGEWFEKRTFSLTHYLNDDYEGGEIEFYVGDDFYPYKPKTGDVLVFPSDEPYYHGVKTILKTNKFFTTNFVSYTYNGHPDWLENQRKYGAHHWSKMEIERVDKENPTNMRYANRKPE